MAEVVDSMHLGQVKDKWKALVKTVMNISDPQYTNNNNNNVFKCKWAVARWQWL
jgi:hypothetical protein